MRVFFGEFGVEVWSFGRAKVVLKVCSHCIIIDLIFSENVKLANNVKQI